MPNSPRLGWPYPGRNKDPWYDAYEAQVEAQDASVYANREDRNIAGALMGGGTLTLDTGTSTFTWTSDFEIFSPITGFLMSVTAGSVAIDDGQILRVGLVRHPTTAQTLTAESASVVEPTNDSFLIGIRRGSNFYFRNGFLLPGDTPLAATAVFQGGGGGSGGGDLGLTVVHAGGLNFNAAVGNLYVLVSALTFSTSGGTVTLPASPDDGDVIGFTMVDFEEGSSNSQNGEVTLDGGGNLIRVGLGRAATSVTLFVNHGLVYVRFRSSSSEWEVFGSERLVSSFELEMSNTAYGGGTYTLDRANFSYQYNGALAGTISLPASPKFGDSVQLREVSSVAADSMASITIDGNGEDIRVPYATSVQTDFPIRAKGAVLTLRFDSVWWLVSGELQVLLSQGSDLLLASDGSGNVVTVASSTIAGVSASLFDANTVLKADSDDTPVALTVAEASVVGRTTGGSIDALDSGELLHLIYEDSADDITDATTGTETSYDPTGWAGAHTLRWTAASALTIQGAEVDASSTGFVLRKTIVNLGTDDITIEHEDGGAAAADRFVCPGGSSFVVTSNESVEIQYSIGQSRWVVVSREAGSGGGISATLFDANTILKADSDDTPVALAVPDDNAVIGRSDGDPISVIDAPDDNVVLMRSEGDPLHFYDYASLLHVMHQASAGDITDSTTGTETSYNPTNWLKAHSLRWTGGSALTLNGILAVPAASSFPLMRKITNLGSVEIAFGHEQGSASAADRINCPGSVEYILAVGASIWIVYSVGAGRWHIMDSLGGGSSGGSGAGGGGVAASLFDANTILKADSDDTPLALSVPTNSLVGRQAGNITTLAIDENEIVARVAAGDVSALGIAETTVLGRRTGDTISALSPSELLHLLYEDTADDITDATTGTETSYDPTGWAGSHTLRWTAASGLTIQGAEVDAGSTGFVLHKTIVNLGTDDITIEHENGSAAAGDRFVCPGGSSFVVSPNESAEIHYSIGQSRWVVVSREAGAGGGGVSETLFDANTILKADSDDTPVALTVAASTIVGRTSSGVIDALTYAEIQHLLYVAGDISDTTVGSAPTYNPTGWSTAHTLGWAGVSTLTLRGAEVDTADDEFVLRKTISNLSSVNIVITHEDGAALASDRFFTPSTLDFILLPFESCQIEYNVSSSRWVVISLEKSVAASLFDANTILSADTDNTPAALTVDEATFVGRSTGGVIDSLTAAESHHILYEETTYDISDATTGTETSYDPTFWSTAHTLRWTGGAGLTIQGMEIDLANTSFVLRRTLVNLGSDSITIEHESGSAAAGDRVICPGGASYVIAPNESATLAYSVSGTRWVVVATAGATGAVLETLFDANTILKADSDDTPAALTVGVQSFVGRQAGTIDAVSVGEEEIVARQTGGNLGGIAIGEDEIVARAAGGSVDGLAVAASTIVGRPAAGALGALTAAEVLGILFPGQTFFDDEVQTTDDTPTTISTYSTLADERVVVLLYTVSCREPATDDTLVLEIRSVFNRDGASALTELDNTFTELHRSAGAADWDVNLAISSQDVLIQVIGEGSHTIEWRCEGKAIEHGA